MYTIWLTTLQQPTVQINNREIEDHTYLPSERTIEKVCLCYSEHSD
jgi:hypothetical protein